MSCSNFYCAPCVANFANNVAYTYNLTARFLTQQSSEQVFSGNFIAPHFVLEPFDTCVSFQIALSHDGHNTKELLKILWGKKYKHSNCQRHFSLSSLRQMRSQEADEDCGGERGLSERVALDLLPLSWRNRQLRL